MSENKKYWDSYYKNTSSVNSAPKVPSQFAAFVAQEINWDSSVVDVGCGNGRDSVFFASLGFDVLGLDSSRSAIEACRRGASTCQKNLHFKCCSVTDDDFQNSIREFSTGDLVIYSRFFLHAITVEEEEIFFRKLSKLDRLQLVALEFRTDRDLSQPKATAHHYRRFISPSNFSQRVYSQGFKIIYSSEGFGFAKYRNDDAYVARFLLEA